VQTESSVTYLYQVEATRTGSFTIPAVPVSVDGRTLQTQPVVLKVEKGGGKSAEETTLGFLEVVLPKKTAYVGEMVPVEIRVLVDARVRWQVETMPSIPGDGFTKQKLPEPRQEHGTKDGRSMDVLVFRTAVTPSKAGKITLGPVEMSYLALVPRAQRNRPRSLFDLLDDSVFGDPFFGVNQHFKLRAEPVELEVKPLPAAGRPESFSGAVGQFTFKAAGAPNRVKAGDPITMKLSVSGRGNFDRIEAPALADPDGWRSYPASADFKASDDLGVSGTKTFSMAVIPEAKKTAMPVFEFAYFDPAAEKYVKVKSEPAALTVEGSVPAAAVPAVAEPKKSEAPKAEVTQPNDIFGVRYDPGRGARSFEPLYARRGFLVAQLVPLGALGVWLLLKLRRTDADAKRTASWRREKAGLLAKLRSGDLSEQEFLETAAQAIQLETALVTGHPPRSVDAPFACASRPLDAETIKGVERIFGARAELLYAGAGGGRERLSPDDRRSVLATVANFEKSHAH
jgi:hypothetical protein